MNISPENISFEPGAPAKNGFIPLYEPSLGGNALKYLQECVETNWVSSAGPFVERFEKELASYVGAKHAVAVVNGTAALHIALLVAGIGPDAEVLLPSLTFIAPANAVRYCGAWPVFIDVEPKYWQIDVQRVFDFLHRECEWKKGKLFNKKSGRQVKGLLPVDLLGHPVDMDPLLELARKFDLVVIEDATESLGARYRGQRLGSHGDIVCFSFNGNKLITTGGGGMIVTSRRDWAEQSRYLATQAKDDPVEYIHGAIGYNYRLTNLQAALGCSQLEKIENHITAKKQLAKNYEKAFANIDRVEGMAESPHAEAVFWLYTILVNAKGGDSDSRKLMRHLALKGIQTRPLWQPLPLSPAHQGAFVYGQEVARNIARRSLSLPSSVGLSAQDQSRVIQEILHFLEC